MYVVYAIKSQLKDWIYIGMTNNLQRRIKQHNLGHNRSTKAFRPFQLLFHESFPTRTEARDREKFLKSTSGKRWIRNNFQGDAGLSD